MTQDAGATKAACRFCSSAMHQFGRVLGMQVLRCPTCLYVECLPRPRPQSLTNLYADPAYHRFDYMPERTRTEAQEWCPLANRLRAMLPDSGGLVVELGPGTGGTLLALRAAGLRVRGFELSAAASEYLRDNFGLDVNVTDVEDFELPKGTVAVLAFHVIEHLREPEAFLACISDGLPPGGVLVLEVPDFDASMRKQLGDKWPYWLPGEHLQHFSAASFRAILPLYGFEVVRLERRGGLGLLQTACGTEGVAVRAGSARPAGRLRAAMYGSRRAVYAVPGARAAVRSINRRIGYDLLRRNAYLQVWARRTG